jgi:hypothetical protein
MYDLTCINGMTDFDSVTQWLVPFAGRILPGGEEPLRGLQPTSLREIVIVDQNFQGAVVARRRPGLDGELTAQVMAASWALVIKL